MPHKLDWVPLTPVRMHMAAYGHLAKFTGYSTIFSNTDVTVRDILLLCFHELDMFFPP